MENASTQTKGANIMATSIVAENLKAAPLPKSTLIVAREDGRLYVVDFSERPQQADPGDIDWNISTSKIVIGKLQQTRTKLLTLEELEFENVTTPVGRTVSGVPAMELTVFGSLDGKNDTITVKPAVITDADGYVLAKCRVTARNFALQLRGSYILNTVQVTMHQSGRR